MKTITNWKQLQALEGTSEPLKAELERYFIELVTEMLDEEEYLDHDISYLGPIAVMESSDNINHLPELGMTESTVTLLESIPEYIEEVSIVDEAYYRIIVILSADAGQVIYINQSLVTDHKDRTTTYTYDPINLIQRRLPNGASTEYGYDGVGRIQSVIQREGIYDITILEEHYTYDKAGNRIEKSKRE